MLSLARSIDRGAGGDNWRSVRMMGAAAVQVVLVQAVLSLTALPELMDWDGYGRHTALHWCVVLVA